MGAVGSQLTSQNIHVNMLELYTCVTIFNFFGGGGAWILGGGTYPGIPPLR